ncbi:DUF317 domain-containing protein [Streptomyces sp. NPDC059096]|uniref:DUF317 domain-containing protein n=1 Tax=Streptomyces sp. NPDC059096 TaxID=3346727 RepID=UPI003694FC2D
MSPVPETPATSPTDSPPPDGPKPPPTRSARRSSCTAPTATTPGWYARFGELVPAEVLGSLTDALHNAPPAEAPDPQQTLISAGWELDGQGVSRSPDGMCRVDPYPLHRQETATWYVEAHEHGYGHPDGPRIWSAWFDRRTPSHLLNAFVSALADTTPLQRAMHDRTAHYSSARERSALSPQQVVDAHTARLDALRVQARAAKRRQPTTAKAPAPPTRTSTPLRR